MANRWYDLGLEDIGDQSIDYLNDDIRLAFVGAGYVPNTATDEFLSAMTADIVARSIAFTGKTIVGRVLSADDLSVFVSGGPVTQAVIFKHTGSDATARLLMYYDTGVGMPFTASGRDVPVVFAGNGIGSL